MHELLGSKRGVQVELALSRIINVQRSPLKIKCSIWGISATIGNMDEAREVLLSSLQQTGVIVKAEMNKKSKYNRFFQMRSKNIPGQVIWVLNSYIK
jgi:ATP-dependent Lhr-like helicase